MVSIVIPVYNTSPYIEKCVVTLMEQSYKEIEFLFIDDCSTDNSVAVVSQVIERYPNRKTSVRILKQSFNQGSAAARNRGLKEVKGAYVMFVDSDDWLDSNCVAEMVSEIDKLQADIVYCDYYESFENNENYLSQSNGTDGIDCIEAMLWGRMHGSTWNKIYRQSFLHNCGQNFQNGADLFEDVGWNVRLFALAERIGYVNKAFYHYVQYNTGSIINSMMSQEKSRLRALQRIWNVEVACRFLQENGYLKGSIVNASNEWKLLAKNDLLTHDFYSCKRWIVAFPESDRAIVHCKKITWNYKLLLLSLHHRCLLLYQYHRAFLEYIKKR